jgi:uncharacterized protein (TIGR03435 family)
VKHDDKNTENIDERLYNALQLPPQDIVEADCERVRTRLAAETSLRGTRNILSVRPDTPSVPRWRRLVVIAAAAAVLMTLFIGVMSKESETSGIAKSADGRVYEAGETVRSAGEQGTVMTLEDGSRVEMRSGAEASVERAADGVRIRLSAGSIIVNAAKQATGRHLYVQTNDVTVSVIGTIFLVKADKKGSHVAVIEGEVHVQQGAVEISLRSGERFPFNPESEDLKFYGETGWSREAFAYLSKLHESMAQSLAARQSSERTAPVSDKPKFEEASIRPCEQDFQAPEGARGGGPNSLRLSPGRVDAVCMTLATLIRTAFRPLNNNSAFPGEPPAMHTLRMDSTYGLGMEDGTRVRGGPNWVRSDKYTIAAVGEGSASAATLQGPMLMELLERRFQLKVHVDVEQIPVYALTVAPGGLKMKPVARGSCVMELPSYIRQLDGGGTAIDPAARQRQSEDYRRGATPRECVGSSYTSGPNVMHVGGEVSISSLVERLQGMAYTTEGLDDRLVLDRTGIPDSERFTLVLEYAAVRTEHSEPMRPGEENIPKGPSIFTALERLGLRLEQVRDSREFVVIDHIERPSDN